MFINGRPQYIRYLRSQIKRGRLLLFVRGEIGESRRHLHLVDGIVVNSKGIGDYVRQFIEPEQVPVYFVPNSLGDEFPVSAPPPDRFTRSPKTILFAGRIIPEKGVLELLEAFDLVRQVRPNTQLLIYGARGNYQLSGDLSEYERAVRSRAAKLPEGSVCFCGYVPNQEMGRQYVNADLAVFPSVCIESFGMVALEAMRCGTPVIASRRPGFEELVVDGKTGLLIENPKNKTELAKTIISLIDSPERLSTMGQAGYIRSLFYSPASISSIFTKIVKELSQNLKKEALAC